MSRKLKISLVLGGYALAFAVSFLLAALEDWRTSGPAFQACSGMTAFSEVSIFFATLVFLSAFPTALALWFLRKNEKFWRGASWAALAWGLTAPLSEGVNIVWRVMKLGSGGW